MIRTIYIKCNAANPLMALPPFTTFIGSPSSVRVIDVPKRVGNWKITDVYVTVTYPDNAQSTVKCVLANGAWVGTLEAPTKSGKCPDGYKIAADGVDEAGTEVSNYILGKGDVIVSGDSMTTETGTSYVAHVFDTKPTSPNKGDICYTADGYQIWNGEEWVAFGGYDFSGDIIKKADAEQVSTYFTGVKTVKTGKTTDFDRYYSIDCEYDNGSLKNLSVTIEGQTVSQATPISDKQISIDPFGSIGQRIQFSLFATNEMVTLHSIYNSIDIAENIALVQLSNYGPNQSVKYKTVKESIESHLDGYATESWVEGKNYLTSHQSLDGYATESWVEDKNYLTSHQSLDGYATESWVENKNYLTAVPDGYVKRETDQIVIGNGAELSDSLGQSASNSIAIGKNAKVKSTVSDACQIGEGTNKNSESLQFRSYPLVMFDGRIPFDRISSTIQNAGYEKYSTTQAWVGCEFYNKNEVNAISAYLEGEIQQIPPVPTGCIATQAWVEGQNYLKEHQSLEGYATESWVEGKGYLTEHQSLQGYATESWVEGKNYLTAHQSLDDYYTKSETSSSSEIATALQSAGKVKTVNNTEPDESGNISIEIPSVDGFISRNDDGSIDIDSDGIAKIQTSEDGEQNVISFDVNGTTSNLAPDGSEVVTTSMVNNMNLVKSVNNATPDSEGNVTITAGGSQYTLETVVPTLVDGTYECYVQNYTSTTISLTDSIPVRIYLPSQEGDSQIRDFIIVLEVSSATPPNVAFVPTGDETINFEAEDDDWATVQTGANIISFTETRRG